MPEAPRRRPLFGPFIRIGLLLTIGAGIAALALLGDLANMFRDVEDRALALERAKRRALWTAGQSLPGTPDLAKLSERLATAGMALGQPMLVRIFKREFELEIWMRRGTRYEPSPPYPISPFPGRPGQNLRRGPGQAPEVFYTVSTRQLNPNSRWHRSFNLGFPNVYDRAHGRTGSFLMVHGGCSSVGCYAMTNAVIDEIWQLVTAALSGGQRRIQVQAFPFRMTDENMAAEAENPQAPFWRTLKEGNDLFLSSGAPPRVSVCDRNYVFRPGAVPALATAGPIGACAKPSAKATTKSTRSASR